MNESPSGGFVKTMPLDEYKALLHEIDTLKNASQTLIECADEVERLRNQLAAARAEVERLTAERDALREALASVATGLRTFVPSHENSEAFARECDAALESDAS